MMKVYSFYDSKIELYSFPFLFRNDEEVKRCLPSIIKGTDIEKYKEDFILNCLGNFNESTGAIDSNIRIIGSVESLLGGHNVEDSNCIK